MANMVIKKSKIFLFILVFLFLAVCWYVWYHRIIILKSYNYKVPIDTLIVAEEGMPERVIIERILNLAFPEFKIIFSNDIEPHLIIKTPDGKKITSEWDAPYIFFSGERYGIKRNRRNGPPIVELLSRTPIKSNQCYLPFILSSSAAQDFKNIRKHKGGKRDKILAYINSNCRKNRELFFKKAREYDLSSEALGKCSNTGKRAHGGWFNLGDIYREYIFGIAMENRNVPGYVTEKIMNVFAGGAIPIYWGDSETVRKWINPKAYIDVSDFSDFDQVIRYLDYLVNNPKKLRTIQEAPIFRDGIVPEFLDIYKDPPNKNIRECAEMIRREFFKQVI